MPRASNGKLSKTVEELTEKLLIGEGRHPCLSFGMHSPGIQQSVAVNVVVDASPRGPSSSSYQVSPCQSFKGPHTHILVLDWMTT